MLTESFSSEQADCYRRLLGTPIVSKEVLTSRVDRYAYFAPVRDSKEHVFLDPDVGIRLHATKGMKAPQYIFSRELVDIAKACPERLLLVYDQSLARGAERQQLQNKLSALAAEGVYGGAYVSHACFVLLGTDRLIVADALESLERESGSPAERFLRGAPGRPS